MLYVDVALSGAALVLYSTGHVMCGLYIYQVFWSEGVAAVPGIVLPKEISDMLGKAAAASGSTDAAASTQSAPKIETAEDLHSVVYGAS